MYLLSDHSVEKFRARQEPRPAILNLWGSSRVIAAWTLLFLSLCVQGQQRFPPPDFEGGHQIPTTSTPSAHALWLQYQDLAVLATALSLATWLVYRQRSRKTLIGLSVFSLAYFGFYKKGCVCAIGSVQNVTLALFDSSYAIPATILGFFLLPLVFSLFFGRTFCAAVCPHGALQDLVLLKPIKVPAWLEHGFSILPFVYLGAGVLFAGTGSAFIFCEYDPFVPVFRMSGRTLMVVSGIALLLLGIFVGRPYCRFLCPFGALLKLGAAVAKRRVRVTPDYCTQCRLCETSCPFGALRKPEAPEPNPAGLAKDRRDLALLLALVPVLVLAGGFCGDRISTAASAVHPAVSLANQLLAAGNSRPKPGPLSPDELALNRARENPEQLLDEARTVQKKFSRASWIFGAWIGAVVGIKLVRSWIFGAWIGAVVGIKLVSLSLYKRRTDFEPSPGDCLACARCFELCPNELARRGVIAAIPAKADEDPTVACSPGN